MDRPSYWRGQPHGDLFLRLKRPFRLAKKNAPREMKGSHKQEAQSVHIGAESYLDFHFPRRPLTFPIFFYQNIQVTKFQNKKKKFMKS